MNESGLSLEQRLALVESVGEEITTKEELKNLLLNKHDLVAYDGFEPSGKIHLPQGLLRAININKMIKAGFQFKVLVADWHAWANHKMGGDLGKIRLVGEYFIEVWKAAGLNLDQVEFVWASDLVKTEGYWDLVMKIAVKNNLPRIIRTVQIMGRNETDSLTASQIIYPLMQAADIFMLKADVTQLGMDQRKVNMLAREAAEDLGFVKPVVVSHHMLLGLLPPSDTTGEESTTDRAIRLKMSKSKPDSAIFMTDSPDEVKRKISNAWCPEGQATENPILEYFKYFVFQKIDTVVIERAKKHGGDLEFKSYQELEDVFVQKKLHPQDLKNSLAEYINEFLEPVQNHFENNADAKKLKEEVETLKVTR
ncbi:tyrosine--tRNA ligase [candidate division WWE3 bacterium]|uniref:tyrosine--tRNA ligase n=1 Tax=candidate division WWE3 bacterium TaxID=2053526 RepID=A0A955RQR8_UNCKA|nr:tyrosine--tRNA ligase [candidate division WWE3 bacterium]